MLMAWPNDGAANSKLKLGVLDEYRRYKGHQGTELQPKIFSTLRMTLAVERFPSIIGS